MNEALEVADGGADIVDIKNVSEGSLGANFPWVIREIVAALEGRGVLFSATLGDLPFKPGTAALAALGATACGVRYVKAGLYGVSGFDEALLVMKAVTRACKDYEPATIVAAAGYADYRRFGGIDPETVASACHRAGADLVMLDTAIKDGKTLFDALSNDELEDFVAAARERALAVALAGSIGMRHIDRLRQLNPDVVGVRGCVCSGRRPVKYHQGRAGSPVRRLGPGAGLFLRSLMPGSAGTSVLKIGGSLITDKTREGAFRDDCARRLAEEIRAFGRPLVVLHGTGSFGKPLARRYDYMDGLLSREQAAIVSRVEATLDELRARFLQVLRAAGVESCALSPAALFCTRRGTPSWCEFRPVERLVDAGISPVISGGIVPDEAAGFAVLSSDVMAARVAACSPPAGWCWPRMCRVWSIRRPDAPAPPP